MIVVGMNLISPPVLEERSCKCGCGMKFRALTTSKSLYATRDHDPAPRVILTANGQPKKNRGGRPRKGTP